jgi:O-antigen ligase
MAAISLPSGSSAVRGAGLALGFAALAVFGVVCGIGIALGEIEALIGSLTLLGAIAVLVDYRIGAVLMMALLPASGTYFFPRGMFGFTGLNPLNLILVATLLSFFARGQIRGFMPKQVLWLYLVPILAAGLLGARHADEVLPHFYEMEILHFTDAAGYVRDIVVKPLVMVLVALLVAAAVARSQKPERFIVPVILAVWVMSVMVIGFVAASGVRLGVLASTGARDFLSAIGMHANDLGRLFAVAYALLLFTWGETKDTALKTTLFVTMVVLTFALMLTFSRGAFLGWLLINLLFVLWKFNAKTLALAALGIGLAALAAPSLPFIFDRIMLGVASGEADAVSAGRIEGIWLPLLPEVLESPLWGHGLLSTTWATPNETGAMLTVTHPHNAFFEALLDMGLIGLGLLVAFYWHVWTRFRALGSNAYLSPTMRGFYQGAAAGMICFAVTGMAGSSLRPVPEFAFLWLAIGMMYGQYARRPAH